MKIPIIIALFSLVYFMILSSADARELGFIEKFSLADDRNDVLKQLIPGSSDYYYYYCLHAQNINDFDKVHILLKQWIRREGYTHQVKEIINRQALLEYERNPQKTLDHIKQELNLRFDHQKAVSHRQTNYPSTLDQKKISVPTLMKQAFSHHKNLEGIEDAGLDILDHNRLDPHRRRNLLSRLQRPDIPNLPKLVIKDLEYKHSDGFGAHAIHYKMTKAQLDECLRLQPNLLDVTHFIHAYLVKLAPSDDVDIHYDMDQKKAYLDRLWHFVKDLTPTHNSLKAHVLFHLLDYHRLLANYDITDVKQLFMTYIKIPRKVGYINPDYMRDPSRRKVQASLTADYITYSRLPPVKTDEALIRDYLSHYFLTEENYKSYVDYIQDKYLQNLFAETKIVNGIGDMEQWYSMLPANLYQALKDRVDLEFAATNKHFFTAQDPVVLELFIKNITTLIVKVFEINTFNYYQANHKQIDMAIQLDGLVATHEKVITYDDPPIRRNRRVYEFPMLNKPGVYVIEFIGNGKSSRAIIQKEKLYHLDRIGPAGHEFIIYDDSNQQRQNAVIHMAGREFVPDENGIIIIPFTANPGHQAIILKDGDQCSLSHFNHESENYTLAAGFYVNRESLIKRNKAQALIRPMLKVNDNPISLSLLKKIRLSIESINIDGIITTKELTNYELFEDKESVVEFQVPENLQSIRFILQAEIKNISRNKKEVLSAQAEFRLNAVDTTLLVEDLHLSRQNDGYVLELLGKNGETKPNQPLKIELKHRYFRKTIYMSLQTNDRGRVHLGKLEQIQWIKAERAQGTIRTWHLSGDAYQYPATIHARAGEALQIPYVGSTQAEAQLQYVLLAMRGNTYYRDFTDTIRIEDGFMKIQGLPAGNYELYLKDDNTLLQLRLTQGTDNNGFIISAQRALEVKNQHPLQIATVDVAKDTLSISLHNVTETTRLHLFGTRFIPTYHPFSHLTVGKLPAPYALPLTKPKSQYTAGRNIGDEYRYILERAYAQKFSGSMLNRPELLLSPWSIRKTETTVDTAKSGEDYLAQPAPAEQSMPAPAKSESLMPEETAKHSTNLDFLAKDAIVLTNLKPDEQGRVIINRQSLGQSQHIHLVATDISDTVYRQVALPEQALQTRELRQLQGLDPEKHFTEQKKITLLHTDETFQLSDITTSEFEICDTMDKVYNIMMAINKNDTLREFEFILTWPEMDWEQKQKKYAQYACHELNFFLYRKDRDFFDRVVMPYIRNKKEKTFLDHWLLGDNLKRYLEPWAFSQLNIVEKILLSKRGADDPDRVIHYVKDRFDLIAPDMDRYNYLFDMVLRGRDLDEEDTFGFDAAKEQAEYKKMKPQLFLGREIHAAPGAASEAEMLMESAAMEPPMANGAPSKPKRKHRQLKALRKERDKIRQFFQKLDNTEEWAENNYYKLPIEEQNADLVTVNAFWNDYAVNPANQPFYSKHFMYATHNFSEMMLALAVLDLPFRTAEHDSHIQDMVFTLKAGNPMIIFHKEIKSAESEQEKIPVLISQNYFQSNDRYVYKHNEQYDKLVTDEFLFQTAYGCQIVISNPTSSRQKLWVLLQIPKGAVPINSGFYTKSIPVMLEPFSTHQAEYHFYFPKSGKFDHYPVQVAKNEQFVTSAEPFSLNVVEAFTKLDKESWDYISQHSSEKEVLTYITTHNVNRIDLEKIAFRMRDRAFFEKIIEILRKQHIYHHTLWSYGLYHKIPAVISEYLEHSAFVEMSGSYIQTPLLSIDPVKRKTYQHLEYKPLVNARAHQLGHQRKILNNRFYHQYHQFMKVLSYRKELTNEDLLTVTYYLLLQDRIQEALAFFNRIDASKLITRLQYDYFRVYLDFLTGNIQQARTVASQYADYPVLRWQKMFRHALSQLDELEGNAVGTIDTEDRDQRHTQLAATETSFDFKIESRKITIHYQMLTACQVNYYPMDIELLFSHNPFMQQETVSFTYIRPNHTQTVKLPESQSTITFDLPDQFQNSNLMVEIIGKGVKKSTVYYANSLDIQVMENYGQIKVAHQSTHKPLSRSYIKVYARMQDGTTIFYKDGYTDIRGRFDYVSLNTNELDFVDRFAILILNEKFGAVIREATPPKR